jgi:hypothetical protein
MSRLRPTPRLHHAPTPTSVARLHGRPKEDLDGAARMSCTWRRRGAPWPPATGLGEPPVCRRGRASGSRARRPAVDPILSVQALHKAFSSLVFGSGERKGVGEDAGRRWGAAQHRQEGHVADLLSPLAAAAASRTAPASAWRHRSGSQK